MDFEIYNPVEEALPVMRWTLADYALTFFCLSGLACMGVLAGYVWTLSRVAIGG